MAGMKATTTKPAQAGSIEAYGVKGLKSTAWRKTFKSAEALSAWAEKHQAEVYGYRSPLTELEPAEAEALLASGTIRLADTGEENSYYTDREGREFYSKNYPNH